MKRNQLSAADKISHVMQIHLKKLKQVVVARKITIMEKYQNALLIIVHMRFQHISLNKCKLLRDDFSGNKGCLPSQWTQHLEELVLKGFLFICSQKISKWE